MEISQLKQIYQLMSNNDFDEIELRLGESERVKMTRSANSSKVAKPECIKIAETNIQNTQVSESLSDSTKTEILSELVGVLFLPVQPISKRVAANNKQILLFFICFNILPY